MTVTIATNPNEDIVKAPHYFFGLSTDTKPTVASPTAGLPIPTTGSYFFETDTGISFVTYDGTTWVVAESALLVVPLNLFEWTSATWIAAQALTADGVQLSDEKTQAVGGEETQVFGATFEPPKTGTLIAVSLGLTCQLKSGEATAAKKWRWKARNKAGTWVNLHAEVSENLTTSYVEKYRSGVFYAIANFNQVPFEVGLFCTPHAETASATIISQVKSSSQAIAIYKPA